MKLAHVVAYSTNRVIGNKGELPWTLKKDLARFKEITNGHPIIMGRKTHESIGRILPGRLNIVISRNLHTDFNTNHNQSLAIVSSIDQAIQFAEKTNTATAFIIGGGEIYNQTIDKVDAIFVTEVHAEILGDTFYPPIPDDFSASSNETFVENNIEFSFVSYYRAQSKRNISEFNSLV